MFGIVIVPWNTIMIEEGEKLVPVLFDSSL